MKNFLVPIDFSEASHNAAKYAVSLGEVLKAKIIFINVVPVGLLIQDESIQARIAAQQQLVETNKELISKVIKELSKNYLVSTEGYVAEGSPSDMILEMAEENKADLIIMGMKGKGKSNFFFGSTTTSVIKNSPFSVLVIPETASYESIDTICFATDLNSQEETKDIPQLIEIAKKYNSLIQVLNVKKPESQISDPEFINKMKTHFTFEGMKYNFNVVEDAKVINGINKFLDENPAEILAMVSRKHTFLERLFGTIHTKQMSQETKIPLMVLKG
ncbi:MAG: universal stress protein [Ginsengibacter sp.]